MKLKQFLIKNKIKTKIFADNLNLTYMAISCYLNNKRIPKKEIFKSIYLNTNGKVQPNDFFPIDDWKKELSKN